MKFTVSFKVEFFHKDMADSGMWGKIVWKPVEGYICIVCIWKVFPEEIARSSPVR